MSIQPHPSTLNSRKFTVDHFQKFQEEYNLTKYTQILENLSAISLDFISTVFRNFQLNGSHFGSSTISDFSFTKFPCPMLPCVQGSKTIDFNNKPVVNGSFPHVCVEHCHNRWRTETKNRIILHVKEISYLQKLLLVLMTNSIINHNSHAHFMLESRVLANTYTFSDPVSTNCLKLRFSLRFPQLIEPTTVEEQDLLGTMLARQILDFPSLCSDVQTHSKRIRNLERRLHRFV